jgi:hypothetical protein
MTATDFRVRRATIEDLPALVALWQSMNLPTEGMDLRLTEFQVATDASGTLVGAIGFQLLGKQARLHGEGFTDFGAADTLRAMLWERLQTVAANHGIIRVWSQEQSPFWSRNILSPPDAGTLAKLPPEWQTLPGEWLTIKLREDVDEVLSLDKEFAVFAAAERQHSKNILGQAKVMKTAATVVALILGVAVLIGVIYMLLKGPFGSAH